MVYSWYDIGGYISFTNSLPHIDPPIWSKDFEPWFISPKDFIPLLYCPVFERLGPLEPFDIVLLPQQWFFESNSTMVICCCCCFFLCVCCFFFHYVSAKFHLWPSLGDLPRPRIGMLSLETVSPVITAFHSCCLSHHIFDQVNLWPAWVGFETAISWQCSPGTVETQRLYPLRSRAIKDGFFGLINPYLVFQCRVRTEFLYLSLIGIILRWGFLIWELIFIYCGLFVLI